MKIDKHIINSIVKDKEKYLIPNNIKSEDLDLNLFPEQKIMMQNYDKQLLLSIHRALGSKEKTLKADRGRLILLAKGFYMEVDNILNLDNGIHDPKGFYLGKTIFNQINTDTSIFDDKRYICKVEEVDTEEVSVFLKKNILARKHFRVLSKLVNIDLFTSRGTDRVVVNSEVLLQVLRIVYSSGERFCRFKIYEKEVNGKYLFYLGIEWNGNFAMLRSESPFVQNNYKTFKINQINEY